MKAYFFATFYRRKDVGKVVLNSGEIHLVKDDEHRRIPMRCRQQNCLEKRGDHISVRQHVVIASQARRIRPLRTHRAYEQKRIPAVLSR